MHVIAFASGSGTNFEQLILESQLPNSNFTIDMLVTDKETKRGEIIGALKLAEKYKVPRFTLDGFKYCGSWKKAQQSAQGIAEYNARSLKFNQEIYKFLREYEADQNFKFDFAVLAGYMRFFRGALQRRFYNTSANVHPGALEILDESGKRKYIGDNAVYDALVDGQKKTRSTVITVVPETDAGAILSSGNWVKYAGDYPITQDKADEHQGMQKELSDWPALRFTIRSIANGELALSQDKFHLDGNSVVYFQDEEMPYKGVDLEEMGL